MNEDRGSEDFRGRRDAPRLLGDDDEMGMNGGGRKGRALRASLVAWRLRASLVAWSVVASLVEWSVVASLVAWSVVALGAAAAGCSDSGSGGGGGEVDAGPAVCGDGVRSGAEVCDGPDLGGASCEDLGYTGGSLSCGPTCLFDGSGCEGDGVCGNGIRDEGEECDGADLDGMTCWAKAGLLDGELGCDESCGFDTSGCYTCGDGILQGSEECDGVNLGGTSCQDLGFLTGVLQCGESCRFDASRCAQSPANWYDEAWSFRRELKVRYLRVPASVQKFPVLVSLSDPALSGKLQPMGQDLRFTLSDGETLLPHEVERVDAQAGEVTAWVRLPLLSDTLDTPFYVYYGNPLCGDGSNSPLVWDTGYLGVWHLDEETQDGGVGVSHPDSTGNLHYAAQYGAHRVSGVAGGAQHLDGGGDYIDIEDVQAMAMGDTDFTFSAWIRTDGGSSMGVVAKREDGVHEDGDKVLGVDGGSGGLTLIHGGVTTLHGSRPVTNGSWHHIVWVQRRDALGDQELWEVYVDGTLDATAMATTLPDVSDHSLHVGGLVAQSPVDNRFLGEIDEVRMSAVPRSWEWIATCFANGDDPTSFIMSGPEEEVP